MEDDSRIHKYEELTEREAAAELRMSVDLLQSLRAQRKIGFAKSGRRVFYPISCIKQYRQDRINAACPTSSSSAKENTGASDTRKVDARSILRRARQI